MCTSVFLMNSVACEGKGVIDFNVPKKEPGGKREQLEVKLCFTPKIAHFYGFLHLRQSFSYRNNLMVAHSHHCLSFNDRYCDTDSKGSDAPNA